MEPAARQRWDQDVVTENASLTTTGGLVWPAAGRMASFLEAEAAALGLSVPGVSILELGAGLGWLGMVCARNIPGAACVCLTEQEEGRGVEWLAHNVALNPALPNLLVLPCDWNDYCVREGGAATTISRSREDSEQPPVGPVCPSTGRPWDFVIGSDLIYTEGGSEALPQALRGVATPGHTRILYCHTKHRFDHLDILLVEGLHRWGLGWEEVREAGVPTPPPSPPPLTELFPEKRIGVFSIGFLPEAGGCAGEDAPLAAVYESIQSHWMATDGDGA